MVNKGLYFHRSCPLFEQLTGNEYGFSIWAPDHTSIDLHLFSSDKKNVTTVKLQKNEDGYFSEIVPDVLPGMLYGFSIDKNNKLLPDPYSHFQPYGPLDLSQIIDCTSYIWHDSEWKGISIQDAVLYEMHIGTFTREGSWKAACKKLQQLVELGINVIELMPVAEFSGNFGWGYDVVNLFAPYHLYGSYDDCKYFIDQAHANGIAVILDVVYNHLGIEGDFILEYSQWYFSTDYTNEWGKAINFDGSNSKPVRTYILDNVCYWIEEFHFDGLRIDATQQIFDASPVHILEEIAECTRKCSFGKKTILIAENEPQESHLIKKFGIDAIWNDDFHRSATVAITSHSEAYYSDYRAHAQEFISIAKYGFLYQGTFFSWQKKFRGTPSLDLSPYAFIHYLQNHDQVANTCHGRRIHLQSSCGLYRAMTAVLILFPQIPMLFQGQEFGSTSPFYFFSQHGDKYNAGGARRRAIFLSQFQSIAGSQGPLVPMPSDPQGFESCKLSESEREMNADIIKYHRDLINIRKNNIKYQHEIMKIDGAVLNEECFVIRYFCKRDNDKLLLVNMGKQFIMTTMSEPLLAPPESLIWHRAWYSDDPIYGGDGAAMIDQKVNWVIPGESATFFESRLLQ